MMNHVNVCLPTLPDQLISSPRLHGSFLSKSGIHPGLASEEMSDTRKYSAYKEAFLCGHT